MSRDFIINGETLVSVKLGEHVLDSEFGDENPNGTVFELGLTTDAVRIIPNYVHYGLRVNDYGPQVPANLLAFMADCQIQMTLIHYDRDVLDAVLSESLALDGGLFFAGRMSPAGIPMGNLRQPITEGEVASGTHFMRLYLASPQLEFPWRFLSTYLTGPPVILPLGTQATAAQLNWRAIPYNVPPTMTVTSGGVFVANEMVLGTDYIHRPGEIVSSGILLWDHIAVADDLNPPEEE